MSAYRLHRGLHVRLQGHGECVIEKRLPGGSLQLKNIATNQFTTITEEKLIDALFSGALDLLGESNGLSLSENRITRNIASELSLLSDSMKEEVKRRFAYVNAIKLAAVKRLTPETLAPIIEKMSRARNDARPPSWITLYRWCRRYKAADEDLMSLTPAFNRRGNTNSKFVCGERCKSDEVANVISSVIEEKYLSKERPSVANIYSTVVTRIDDKNKFREADDRLPIPNPNSIYEAVNKLDPYLVMKERFGARIADEKYKPIGIGVRPTRPLERVEIDHTPLDLMVVDPVMRLPIGRPTITTVIDKYTRILLGKYMSFNPPSYLSVMQCLRHAIAPKTYIREMYPSIINTWDAYGIPETD
jgi:putative transposase